MGSTKATLYICRRHVLREGRQDRVSQAISKLLEHFTGSVEHPFRQPAKFGNDHTACMWVTVGVGWMHGPSINTTDPIIAKASRWRDLSRAVERRATMPPRMDHPLNVARAKGPSAVLLT